MFKIYDGRDYFYQWDLDRKLIVENPEIKEVHFCNRLGTCSLNRYVYEVNGMYLVDVPNLILQESFRMHVYGYDTNHTKYSTTYEIKARTRPENYVYTDEELETWKELDERITELEQNGVTEETISNAVNAYLEENPVEVDLSNYYNKTEVDEAIANVDVDLTGYATKAYVDEAIGAIDIGGGTGEDIVVEANFPADVLMIPCYGQSLACNTSAGASTFSSTYPLIYNTSLTNTNIQDMSAGTAEGFKIAADYYGVALPENLKIVSSVDGAGGVSVKGLSKGTTYYNKLINSVQTCKNNCDAQGLTMNVPCFTWTQGEEDMRCGGNDSQYGSGNWDPFTYKDRLKQLIDDLNADIKAITGQTNDVLCVSYQTACHTSYQRYPRIALQQLDLSKEDSRMIVAKIMYDVDYVTEGSGYQVHAPARTYRNMGNLYGIAAFESCILDKKFQPTQPLYHMVNGKQVFIRFNAPTKPLRFDTKLINQLPDKNYGFNIYNVEELSGEAGTIVESETKITNVQIISDDTVIINLNQEPKKNDRLTYAINGDYWQNITGTKVISTGGEGEDGITKSGWQYGARGCLRDSSRLANNNDGAVFNKLYNWCPIFEIDLTPTTGSSVITYTWNDDLTINGSSEITSNAQNVVLTASCTALGSNGLTITENNSSAFTWTVDNEEIATISNGILTFTENTLSESRVVNVTVTLKAEPTITRTHAITQKYYVQYTWNDDLVITGSSSINGYSQNVVLTASCTGNGNDGSTITETNGANYNWTSGDETIATVANGIVSFTRNTSGAERTVTITATLKLDTSITNTFAITQAAWSLEEEVEAFSEVVSVSDETKDKLNTLVDTLKTAGVWSKIKGIYPMVGSQVSDMAYNLKDTEAYPIVLSSTATTGSDGLVLGDQTSDNYSYIASPTYSINSCHLIYSSDADLTSEGNSNGIVAVASAGESMGSASTYSVFTVPTTKAEEGFSLYQRNRLGTVEYFDYAFESGTNYLLGTTTAHKAIINGELLSPRNNANATWDMTKQGGKIVLGGYQDSTFVDAFPDTKQIFFLGWGDELTAEELEAYSTAINAFKSIY